MVSSCATMFLFMIAELGAVKSVVELLTGLNGTVVVIVQVIVTTIYTSNVISPLLNEPMLMSPKVWVVSRFPLSQTTSKVQ